MRLRDDLYGDTLTACDYRRGDLISVAAERTYRPENVTDRHSLA
jgi:hypothetical protein